MVTSILKCMRFGFAILATLLLLMRAEVALATTVEMAPGLHFSLPDPLAIRAVEPQTRGDGVVLAGEIGDAPGYFMAAVRVSQWERNNTLWQKLEDEIVERSSAGTVATGIRGSFVTLAGDDAWYQEYTFESDGRQHRQVYYLLRSERSIYWVILTMTEGVSTELAVPIARVLIRRARLAQ